MRSGYIPRAQMEHVLAALMPYNRLAVEVSLDTGLRIGDVLAIRSAALDKQRFTVRENKTGKTKRVYLRRDLWERCKRMRGKEWLFEGRLDPKSHRTRQAVWKDLHRAADAFRLKIHISPHSARKIYAVDQYYRTWDLRDVQRKLNHSDIAVTAVYVMAASLADEKYYKMFSH